MRATLEDGLLTLEARDAPLYDVLVRLGELSGFGVRRFGDDSGCTRVDADYERMTPALVVERLVAASNRIIFYAPRAAAPANAVISQVWLLGAAADDVSGGGDSVPLPGEGPAAEDVVQRSEAVLQLSRRVSVGTAGDEDDALVLQAMSLALQQDPDPLVRARAAIALGALGDAATVGDLEAAMRDPHFSVRAQAIGALGRIDDERAAGALGGLLLDTQAASVERVMAAQALWRQASESALEYLALGAGAADPAVREAASTPAAGSTDTATTAPLDGEVTR